MKKVLLFLFTALVLVGCSSEKISADNPVGTVEFSNNFFGIEDDVIFTEYDFGNEVGIIETYESESVSARKTPEGDKLASLNFHKINGDQVLEMLNTLGIEDTSKFEEVINNNTKIPDEHSTRYNNMLIKLSNSDARKEMFSILSDDISSVLTDSVDEYLHLSIEFE